jgi:hypothetical protein
MSNALTLSALLGVATAIGVVYLYRKDKLKEDHALFWLFISFTIIILSIFQNLLLWINIIVQAENPTDVVLASFIFLLILISIYYSVKISELTEKNKNLAQELALLQAHNEREKV